MYNENVKLKYIDTLTKNAPLFVRIFNLIEGYEREIDCDVCEMSAHDYVECIKRTQRETIEDVINVHSSCSRYAKWYCEEMSKNQPEWVDSFDCYEQYENVSRFPPVVTWEDIYEDLLSIYPLTEGYAIWPIAVCAWIGLTIHECCNLRNDDVDIKHRCIRYCGKEFKIEYDSQVKILNAYLNTAIGNREQNRKYVVEMLDIGYLLKYSKTKNSHKVGKKYSGDAIASQFATYLAKAQLENIPLRAMYSYSLIWYMGRYHQMYLLDSNTLGGIEAAKKKDIQDIFSVKYAHPTGKMLLTQYRVYKHRLEEQRK